MEKQTLDLDSDGGETHITITRGKEEMCIATKMTISECVDALLDKLNELKQNKNEIPT